MTEHGTHVVKFKQGVGNMHVMLNIGADYRGGPLRTECNFFAIPVCKGILRNMETKEQTEIDMEALPGVLVRS